MTEHADLLRALAELAGRVAQTVREGDAATARAQAAAQVDQLCALIAGAERTRPAGGPAPFDLARVGDALRAVADRLRAPISAGDAGALQAVAELQAAIAPLAGRRAAHNEAAEREHYRQKARAAMDEYFRQHPNKPFKP